MNQKTDYRSCFYESYVQGHVGLSQKILPSSLEKQNVIYGKLLKNFLPEKKDAKILDIGCGYGSLLYFFHKEGYRDVLGVDHSSQQVQLAHKLGIHNIQQEDFFSFLAGQSSRYDFITAMDVLEHLRKEEVVDFLKKVFSALKPGGKLLIRVPNGTSPFFGNYRYGDFTHETSFTALSIRQVFTLSGLQEIKVISVDPVVHGVFSAIRYFFWKGIESLLRFYLLVETGECQEAVLTQNLMASGVKPL